MTTKISSIIISAFILAVCASCGQPKQTPKEDPMPPIGFRANLYSLEKTSVKSGETFYKLMTRIGLSPEDTKVMTSRLDTVFNPAKLRAGAIVEAYYSGDSLDRKLEYAVYSHNKIDKTVFKCTDSIYVWNYHRPTRIVEQYADVTIQNSLWADMSALGYPDNVTSAVVNDLSDIFAWTVNFFTLKEGDRFQTVWRQIMCEDEIISIKAIDFSRYSSYNEQINAIRFETDGTYDKYYNENGENLRKAFLKAPLEYKRISSKFTYHRKHPVTGVVRPHTAVDYAAPLGTPVKSIGDGTVISCGWTTTGGGNVIKIQHNSTYTTAYLHLQGFAKGIRKGVKVKQGQVIGYVGSTGLSTGPHLDFRVWKNGSPIDPLQMKSPAATPLPKSYKPQLDSVYNHYCEVLESM